LTLGPSRLYGFLMVPTSFPLIWNAIRLSTNLFHIYFILLYIWSRCSCSLWHSCAFLAWLWNVCISMIFSHCNNAWFAEFGN
jgi:hypothetical protein